MLRLSDITSTVIPIASRPLFLICAVRMRDDANGLEQGNTFDINFKRLFASGRSAIVMVVTVSPAFDGHFSDI